MSGVKLLSEPSGANLQIQHSHPKIALSNGEASIIGLSWASIRQSLDQHSHLLSTPLIDMKLNITPTTSKTTCTSLFWILIFMTYCDQYSGHVPSPLCRMG